MADIELLSQDTIDKIAAGEVVERPASVVKELVENAIDAKASIITIEIKKGGVEEIRISDNGIGIPSSQVKKAFLRHSTSKIRNVDDLSVVKSLGFRGEALSSIAAVSKVELITKTQEEELGTLYKIEGALEKNMTEIGAPNGTTFFVRSLFYNTLPRQKFLKSAKTEANYIHEIVEKLSLSHPDIAFQLSIDNKVKVSTVGNGKLKDSIYQIYGRSITSEILEISGESEAYTVHGYIGAPVISRGNRNFENIFINGRFVKSKLISSAIEEAYEGFLMQHQYPFVCLFIDVNSDLIDVNVHPTKLEVRIDNPKLLTELIYNLISNKLHGIEDIREETVNSPEVVTEIPTNNMVNVESDIKIDSQNCSPVIDENINSLDSNKVASNKIDKETKLDKPKPIDRIIEPYETSTFETHREEVIQEIEETVATTNNYEISGEQLSFLSEEAKISHKIIGQLFNTYWLVEFDNSLYIIDQHAAHEKVLYERTIAALDNKTMTSQLISPSVIVTLSATEETFLGENMSFFQELGYEIEHFGGHEYAINGIPDNILGLNAKELFLEMIADCVNINSRNNPRIMLEKIASMSCKAAVKGNNRLSTMEMEHLIDELLSLDNPFHCPHGRPTIIKMSKQEIEKKFRRIV